MQGRARFFSIVVVLFMSLSVAFGQSSTGSVQGIVSDPTGGVAPGVSVTLTNVATQFDTKTLTNDTGFYTFVAVPPGSYTLKAEPLWIHDVGVWRRCSARHDLRSHRRVWLSRCGG
jgi:hypothetical protein